MKNLTLGIMALFLACCLAFLLFLAMNQQALAKVHESISSFSDSHKVVKAKEQANHKANHSISAAMKDTEKNEDRQEPYYAENYVPIAKLTTHNLKNNEVGKSNLPQFSAALKEAQNTVNRDNDISNTYNDYGIDSTCQGTYYYIFTFKNNDKPHMYYRVTVNEDNQAHIFDRSYRETDHLGPNKPCLSPQESEVVAQKYAVDKLGANASLKKVKESKEGMFYTFWNSETKQEYKVIVNKAGDVIRQPALN